MSTHCSILNYLDKEEPELAELIRACCADVPLSRPGRSGIAFLKPSGAFLKKIMAKSNDPNPRVAVEASKMLSACILRVNVKEAKDFRDFLQVPNSLYPNQDVGKPSVSADKVKLGDATITLDKKFRCSSIQDNLSVWNLDGEIPVTTDKLISKDPKKKVGKRGGYVESVESLKKRNAIALHIENQHALNVLAGKSECPHIAAVHSLLEYLREHSADLIYDVALPIMSGGKSDFYLLIEPHNEGEKIISDDIINKWWSTCSNKCACNPSLMDELLDGAAAHYGDKTICSLYSNRAGLNAAIADIREITLAEVPTAGRTAIDIVEAAYPTGNTIGEVKNVYPEYWSKRYSDEPGLKMFHDEFHYIAHGLFSRKLSDYNQTVNIIGELMAAMCQDAETRDRRRIVLNKKNLRYHISPSDKLEEVMQFVNSSCFLQIPRTRAEAKELGREVSPGGEEIWNIQYDSFSEIQTHERIVAKVGGGDAGISDAELLALVNQAGPELREKLKAKLCL
jgi:hypothetical protein